MKKFTHILVVLPCHSLEDFPIHHRGEEAANLLANWTALWHPALIASVESKPNWIQADNPDVSHLTDSDGDEHDADQEQRAQQEAESDQVDCFPLALIPTVANPMMDSELLQNLEAKSAMVVSLDSRDEIVRTALSQSPFARSLADKVDPDIVQDFHALGYAFLQVQIMTRQLRYSSNLDESYFTESLVAAAKAATAGEHDSAKTGLMKCFDILLEEKNAYYPVEPDLLDVVLTADTTLGNSLARQLEIDHPINVLLTGKNAQQLEQTYPETFAKLKERVHAPEWDEDSAANSEGSVIQKANIIGGLQDELPETLVSSESLVNQIHQGIETIKRLFDCEPCIYMRRRFGLTPATPGVLDQFNFAGAIHATLDEGKFPLCSSANIRWTGKDERSILAYGEAPLSAADSGAFVGLGVKLGEAIDSAHIASILFCHWPDNTCESFRDLIRITSYSPLFGEFTSLDEYFDQVYDPGYGDTFTSDEYRNPFLKQAVEKQTPNPVSRYTQYWDRFYRLNSCRSLLTKLCVETPITSSEVSKFQNRIGELQTAIESALNEDEPNSQNYKDVEILFGEIMDAFERPKEGPSEIINTTSFKRRTPLFINSSNSGTVRNKPPYLLGDGTKQGSYWMLELPAMGSVLGLADLLESTDHLKSDPAMVEDLKLRNEFFELSVDEKSGGIRSIQGYKTRANMVGQQLAIRIPSERDSRNQPLTKARYTTMVADKIDSRSFSRIKGSLTSSGKLLDGSECLADFEQTVTLWRGKPIAEVQIAIELHTELKKSVNHYLCSRLAWKNETARVIANSQEDRAEITSDWFNATNFVEIEQDENRLLMLTGGLPFHRRSTRRMLDSLLIVGKETERDFRIGLGVNVPYAMAAAVDWLTPTVALKAPVENSKQAKTQDAKWLFHFSSKNILVTHWQPIFESGDRWSGVRLRIKETEGRNGELSIRCPHEIDSGQKETLANDFLQSYEVSNDEPTKLKLEFGRYDFFQLSIHWKK